MMIFFSRRRAARVFAGLCGGLVLLAVVGPGVAADSAARVLALWPEGVPGLHTDPGPERSKGNFLYNVHQPTLTYFPSPPGKATGTAVIICPGGGYVGLSMTIEGTEIAAWLNSLGVSAFVLKYRLQEYGHPAPLRDVLRAIRLVRSDAKAFGVTRLGVLGASAGGHLAASAGTLFDDPAGRTGAPLDVISAHPDFLVLLYPVITFREPWGHAASRVALLGPNPSSERVDRLSLETQVTAKTPPTFLVATATDRTVPVENALIFYEALCRAKVPAELHVYPRGPHGFGVRKDVGEVASWTDRCEDWLRSQGWLASARWLVNRGHSSSGRCLAAASGGSISATPQARAFDPVTVEQ